jgi:hypothetical protein
MERRLGGDTDLVSLMLSNVVDPKRDLVTPDCQYVEKRVLDVK